MSSASFSRASDGAGLQDPAAGINHGPLGGGYQPHRFPHHAGMAFDIGPVARERGGDFVVGRPVPLGLGLEDVLGHVEQYGARAVPS